VSITNDLREHIASQMLAGLIHENEGRSILVFADRIDAVFTERCMEERAIGIHMGYQAGYKEGVAAQCQTTTTTSG